MQHYQNIINLKQVLPGKQKKKKTICVVHFGIFQKIHVGFITLFALKNIKRKLQKVRKYWLHAYFKCDFLHFSLPFMLLNI